MTISPGQSESFKAAIEAQTLVLEPDLRYDGPREILRGVTDDPEYGRKLVVGQLNLVGALLVRLARAEGLDGPRAVDRIRAVLRELSLEVDQDNPEGPRAI